MSWRKGPLPKGTYGWGAVVEAGNDPHSGFRFADFRGDHVMTIGKDETTRLDPYQVGYYNNSINLPTKEEIV